MIKPVMVRLTKKQILEVAKLAKINLGKSEIKKRAKELSEVISYIKELEETDTNNVQPTSQTTKLENVSRDDVVRTDETLGETEVFLSTNKFHNGYFIVPMVLGQRSDK